MQKTSSRTLKLVIFVNNLELVTLVGLSGSSPFFLVGFFLMGFLSLLKNKVGLLNKMHYNPTGFLKL